MKKLKLFTAVLLIASLLLSICPQVFAATFTWVTQTPIVCNYVYDYCEYGIIVNNTNRVMGLIGVNGNMAIPFEKGYKELSFVDHVDGLIAFVDSSNRAGVMDAAGNIIVPAGLYERIVGRADDYVYIVARKTGESYYGYSEYEYGLGDANGNMIIPYGTYTDIQLGGWYGTVLVRNENYIQGIYTSAGQPVIPIEYGYQEIYPTSSPYRYVAYINESWYLLDNTAQQLAALEGYVYNSYEIYDYILAGDYSNNKLYDLNGNMLGDIGDGKELLEGKYIYDRNTHNLSDIYGNIIVAGDQYFNIRVIDENYYSVCDMDGRCALLDMSGNIMMPYGSFESIHDFYEIYDGKYVIANGKFMDIYGNVLAQTEDYWYHMGNGYFYTENYNFDNDTYSIEVKIAKIEGEPVKPAAPVASSVNVTVNGMPVQFTDQAPVIVDGRTLLPLRAVFDLLGATIEWDGATQTVYAKKDGIDITLTIGSEQLWVNGQAKLLDVRAQIMNGRTMVPVRAASEAFGCNVGWDATTSTVIITTN